MASPHQHPTTIENLPGELLWEILIRIPAKPLARMRCVSKPWNALLSKPSFIKSHRHCSIEINDETLLVLTDGDLHNPFSVMAHFSESDLDIARSVILPVAISTSESLTVKFLGSVNGLICFCYRPDSDHFDFNKLIIQIWNPSLSNVLTLPPCQLPYWCINFNVLHFRFGYDPKTDDYKLVKLMRGVKDWLQVEVYSLRKDSWGLITQSFPSHVTEIFNEDGVYVDGCDGRLHWLGSVGEGRKLQTIVAFDLGMESFSEISLPKSVKDHKESCWHSLGVLAGKLCVRSSSNKPFECEVWVMNEYGVAESWVKHIVVSVFRGLLVPYELKLSIKFLSAISFQMQRMARQHRMVKVVRFGYDLKMDDYKLVKLMRGVKDWLQVEVYSLRKDSWALINQGFPSHVTEIFNENRVYVDGCDGRLHWLGSVGEGRKLQTIVAFDLGTESFSEISLPKSVKDHKESCCWHSLGVMAGKLCVRSSSNKTLECEVWVMNEYGVAESWVKHIVVSMFTGVLIPYGFKLSIKFLSAISVGMQLMARQHRMVKVVRYVESLVWIAPVRSGCIKVQSLQT
ncbi:hypothetical protein OSB04_017819 [Centaurea solstitialis]|uniref:F-box domain-containing protein n=1 Tax=Centaurea solstitialis TaxID=347529 RepID=A0AA38WL38_9ASTR|nr:hypothetical protein OSB04_017819 [Centaurea solstitialis]